MAGFNVEEIRKHFPALAMTFDGRKAIFFDGPGGTQVPQRVIDAVSRYYIEMNSNVGGAFLTSKRSDTMLEDCHIKIAEFVNARYPQEIKFGPNMTTHTFTVSRAIGKMLKPGDEILVTVLDHEANVSPWHALADRGAKVRTVDIHPEDCTLDMGDFESKLSKRTRIIAVGYASNAVGTINDLKTVVSMGHAVGSLVYVDAVHYAPHNPIDVQELDCDFLVCSVYKFFGPHLGVLYGKLDILNSLPADKVRPAHDYFEHGTQNHEGIAGTSATIDYLSDIGRLYGRQFKGRYPNFRGRRLELKTALSAIHEYEHSLLEKLMDGLKEIPGLEIWGITDQSKMENRTPTVSFTLSGWSPRQIAKQLAMQGIFVWDGDFYAQALIERLGIFETGGVLRVGLMHYNTPYEVDRFISELTKIVTSG
jgi:cysteine desulfurase family protein (TIGR01976 family)